MGYSTDPSMVEVNIFKESGKWYTTLAMKWLDYNGDIHDTFEKSLNEARQGRFSGMVAVCLEPYHKHSHPLMMRIN